MRNRLIAGFEKFLAADERRARIPKLNFIGEDGDGGFAGVVAIVLMDEEIQDGFTKREIVRRRAFALHGGVIELKTAFGKARAINLHDTLPSLDDVAFGKRFDAFIPALFRQQIGVSALEDEEVHDLPGQKLVHGGVRAEQQNGSAGGAQRAVHRHDQAKIFEKGDAVLGFRLVARMALVEKTAIPFETLRVEAGGHIHLVQRAVLEPHLGGVPHEGVNLILVALLGRAAFADKGLIHPAIYKNGLAGAGNFRDVENKDGIAAIVESVFLERDGATELAFRTERADEAILQVVGIDNAFDLELSVFVLNAEDEPAAGCVGEGGNGGKRGIGNREGGLLKFHVAPFQLLQPDFEFVEGHEK
jgi:hypothetical protein